MKIEPSGVVMNGICDIQTSRCSATRPAPITAIWYFPNREQVNVCRTCLKEMIRSGQWELQDINIGTKDQLRLVVEVLPEYAQKIHKHLLTYDRNKIFSKTTDRPNMIKDVKMVSIAKGRL